MVLYFSRIWAPYLLYIPHDLLPPTGLYQPRLAHEQAPVRLEGARHGLGPVEVGVAVALLTPHGKHGLVRLEHRRLPVYLLRLCTRTIKSIDKQIDPKNLCP
jgi:hypothetical protein